MLPIGLMKSQTGLRRIVSIPKFISFTSTHVFTSSCLVKRFSCFTFCHLDDVASVDLNTRCLHSILANQIVQAQMFCESKGYNGESCLAEKIPESGILIWSMSRLQVSYKSSVNMLGRQVDTVEPFMPKMLTHAGTVVSCAGIPYEVDSSFKEIFQNSIESSIIGVPGGHSDVIMGEMDLLNRRLNGVESKRNNSADDKSHLLSELAGLQPHHESKLRTALRTIVVFFLIIIALCSIFVVVRCYQSVKNQTNVSLAALRTNQLGRQFNQATL
jgi:hypothetical protein